MQKEPNYENAAKDKKTGKSHRPCVPFFEVICCVVDTLTGMSVT